MKDYQVRITETSSRIVPVEAESAEAAKCLIREQYGKAEIVLDSSDFVDVKFSVLY